MDHAQKEQLIRYLIKNSGPTLDSGEDGNLTYRQNADDRLQYQYAVRKLIDEYFNIHQLGVAANDLGKDLMGVALDMAFPDGPADEYYPVETSAEDDGLVEVFEQKINAIKADIGQGDEITFTVWFPWQISWENTPSTFEIYELLLEPASDTEWSEKLDDLIADPDAFDAGRIKLKTEETDFEYWKTTITAKSPSYAFSYFSSAFKLLSAKLNHSRYYLDGDTFDRRRDTLPGHTEIDARWTIIRKPFAVLWEDDRTDAVAGMDTGFQGCNLYYDIDLEPVSIDYTAIEDRYENYRSFDWMADSQTRLHNALLGYQDGLLATDQVHSFFSFWRVLEELTLAERQNKESVIDKALFGMRVVTSDNYDPVIDDIAEEIWATRNNWVHDPGWTRVTESHEIVTKLLADAMIELHTTKLSGLDERLAKRVLKWATESEEKRNEVDEALNIVENL